MKKKLFRRLIKLFIASGCFVLVSTCVHSAWYDNAEWYDHYYQYRIPVEANPSSSGLQILNIESDTIAEAINQMEAIHHSAKYFDYNKIKIVEYDAAGNIVDVIDSGGFYLSTTSAEMLYNGSFELAAGDSVPTGWTCTIPADFDVVSGYSRDGSKCLRVQSDRVILHRLQQGPLTQNGTGFYLLSFWSKATQNTYNLSVQVNDHGSDYWPTREKSYTPVLFSKNWTKYDAILKEETTNALQVIIYRSITGEAFLDDVSLKKARIDLLVDVDAAGPKKYMIYYQPTESFVRFVPENRIDTVPAQTLNPTSIGSAQRYEAITKYRVLSDTDFDLWFAESTQKITPNLSLPSLTKSTINISSAKNERQSFQLIFKAKSSVSLDTVTIGALSSGIDTIASDKSYLKIVDYVNMDTPSLFADNYISRMADPMIAFSARSLASDSENLILWCTVITDSDIEPGLYNGNILLEGNAGGSPFSESIPLNLKVYKFTLPSRPSFRTGMDGQYFGAGQGGGHNIYEFHGVTTFTDKNTLVRAYYDEMCANKVFPYSVAYGHGYSYQWDPPPHGYNVDEPGNYFYVYDFDFSGYNTEMNYYMADGDVNAFYIGHTNGAIINRFGLTGVTVAWDDPDTSFTAITKLQYDNLIADYWREIAYNLIINGWIDYAYIMIDESLATTYPKIMNFCSVFKADPYASQIRLLYTINIQPYTWKEFPDTETEVSFKDRIDIWCPANNDDGYSFYEDYYLTEHNMDPETEEIWYYLTRSNCFNIDSLGLNNRVIPMKAYFMHGNGYVVWATFYYEDPSRGIQNPWIDPYSPWGNGPITYFYPPGDTVSPTPDFTITPSVRLEMFREGVEDYEYMVTLDDWTDTAAANGIDTSTAAYLKEEMQRMFIHPVRWSVNDEYYLLLRKQIAEEIDKLMWYSTYGEPTTEISKINRTGNDVNISLYATEVYRYNLLRSNELTNPSWQLVDTALISTSDTITLTDDSIGSAQKAFYKVQAVIP